MPDSVYRVTEVIGVSSESWEAAARSAVETAATTVRDLRVAEVDARRVLPTPPVPASVSSLVRPRSDLSSESSRLRPMIELASVGSANVLSRTESGDLMFEFECDRGELVATALDPVVVPVLGQQLGVDVECCPEGRCRLFPACVHCRLFELVDVDLSREVKRAVPRLDRGRVEGAPRDVYGLVEVVGGRRRGEVAPEHVHRLLAMEPVVAGEGEELHELARLLQSPGRVGHRNSVDGRSETAEERQTDVAHLGIQSSPPARNGYAGNVRCIKTGPDLRTQRGRKAGVPRWVGT